MSAKTLNLTPDLYDYLQAVSLREPSVLQELRTITQKMTGAVMQISPEQGQFMGLLMELISAKKTLDIGTFTGYSALVIALALPKEGKVITCDINNEALEVARKHFKEAGVEEKIDIQIGPAAETLDRFIAQGQEGTFDFAFIDADKNNYDTYYEKALTLVRKNGLIAIDNVLWDGKVVEASANDLQTESIRKLNKKLLNDARISLSMLPIGDGLTLARKV